MWNKKYKNCQDCKTTEREYYAKGLCRNCYNKVYSNKWYQKNKEISNTRGKEYRARNLQKWREVARENHQHRRMLILQHYGGIPPHCACCGETTIQFLALDHINGGGTKHRRKLRSSGDTYHWIIRNKFPKGFQVLCHNCNSAKGFYGICPHQKLAIAVNSGIILSTKLTT